jgi:hypothetical protein
MVNVESGQVDCARYGRRIEPGEKWHLDHDDLDPSKYIGASHVRCDCATATHRVKRNQRITSPNW